MSRIHVRTISYGMVDFHNKLSGTSMVSFLEYLVQFKGDKVVKHFLWIQIIFIGDRPKRMDRNYSKVVVS